MKSTGIVRKVDELGRIVLPIEMRHTMGITRHDALEIFSSEDIIMLKKHQMACIFCNGTKNIINYKGKNVCSSCVARWRPRHNWLGEKRIFILLLSSVHLRVDVLFLGIVPYQVA